MIENNQVAEADNVLRRVVQSGRVSEDTAYYAARVAVEATPSRPEQAKRLLERILESKRPFTKRTEAKLLLEQLSVSNP